MQHSLDFSDALAVACQAADHAKLLIQSHLASTRMAATLKPDGSPVTALDKKIELAIRADIRKAFPEHSITGEEYPRENPNCDYEWLIDPIDGTVSLIHGIPTYATLIALCERGLPIVSVVELPGLGQRYTATRGKGSWCGSTRLSVSSEFDSNYSIVSHGDYHTFRMSGYGSLYDALARRIRFFRSYTDAFGHTLVARGAAALMVDAAMEPWDLAAPMLLLQEAGGCVSLYRDQHNSRRFVGVCGNRDAAQQADEIAVSLGFNALPPGQVRLI
jgi:myo-inositol-1(or 4)-monophosphatase